MLAARSRLAAMATLAVFTLAAPPAARASTDFSALTQLAQAAVAGTNVPQAVPGFELLLLQQGVPLYHQSFGAWTNGQLANMDSASKTISGALMMAVTDTHPSFQLETRLSAFLPSFVTNADKADITLRQAFSHTSGLPGMDVGSPILAAENITLQQAAALVARQPLENGPAGTQFAYGGLSMQAAGAATEVATGTAFATLMQQRLLSPLGMTNTRFALPSATSENPRVAGGLESTAADMSSFMDMLLTGGVQRGTGQRVLSAAAVDTMLTRQTNDSQVIANSPTDNARYGIGTWLDQLSTPEAGPVDALAAGARGFHAWIDKDQGLVFVFATDLSAFQNLEALSGQMHAAVVTALAVPEPPALALLAAGGLLVAWRLRRLSLSA